MEIKFFNKGTIADSQFEIAAICAAYKGKWIYVRNKDRSSWEMPAGHREAGEDIERAASRELFEETGAVNFDIEPVCDYAVTLDGVTRFGRLFYANVIKLGPLPGSEIAEVRLFKTAPENLTYDEIHPALQQKVVENLKEKTLAALQKDKVKNINMINFIRNNSVYTFDTVGDSVLIRGRSDEDWVYISSSSEEEFSQIIQDLDEEDKCFAVLEDWMLPHIVKDKKIQSKLTSVKLVYEDSQPLPPIRFPIVDLSISDTRYVYNNSQYKKYLSVDYLDARIDRGIAVGICDDWKLAAWCMTHDDGAIGCLNVLEEHRRKGYGTDVFVEMVNRLLRLGEVPFVHIEEENERSMNLAIKAGFKKDRRLHWIKIK